MLLGHPSEMEVERDHVLGRKITDEADIFAAEDALMAKQAETASSEEMQLPLEALGSQASFDRVLYDGAEFGHSGRCTSGRRKRWTSSDTGLLGPTRCATCCVTGRASARAVVCRARPRRAGDHDP